MKKIINTLVALTAFFSLASCDSDNFLFNDITLSHLTIECIVDEATVSTLTGNEYIQHTYICSGFIEDYTGECRIEIWGNEDDQTFDDCKIKAAGDNTSFAFSFTTKDEYLDRPGWNFIVKVCKNDGKVLYRTMIAATHPDSSVANK